MACATLKRHAFDILDSNCSKRKRLQTCSSQLSANLSVNSSPFVSKEHITQNQLKRRIKEEIKRLQRRRLVPKFLGTPVSEVSSTFVCPTREESNALSSCSGCLRSLALRSPKQDSQDSDSDQSPVRNEVDYTYGNSQSSGHAVSSHLARSIDSVPIFTLSQVTSLCERLVKEREEELRQEYDSILLCKLAEQYEAFLKFNHDQLYSRFQNTPMSYVS